MRPLGAVLEAYVAAGLVAGLVAVTLIALTPSDAYAWGPGTHILLGEAVLRSADTLLPAGLAALLRAFPSDFLYGSIAADTSIAKRYARVGRHCHAWHIGDEILGRARDDGLRAFGYGYLAHLAADVVAHNHFVPHQLAITSSSSGIGHAYWESRFETHAGEGWARRARAVIQLDHGRSDDHLDRILSPTLFSTPTNRRIFRGQRVPVGVRAPLWRFQHPASARAAGSPGRPGHCGQGLHQEWLSNRVRGCGDSAFRCIVRLQKGLLNALSP